MTYAETSVCRRALASALFTGLCLGTPAFGQFMPADAATTVPASNRSTDLAMKHVKNAAAIVQTLRSDSKLDRLLQQAKGVFLVPSYTRIALGMGGGGGTGLLLARLSDGSWSDPAFFHVGAISVGLQVGVESGPAALILNSSKTLDHFMKPSAFSLNADVGLTLVNWSVTASGETGDIVAWSSNRGLFGNAAAASVSGLRFSKGQTNAIYGQQVKLEDVLAGRVKTDKADALRQAFSTASQ